MQAASYLVIIIIVFFTPAYGSFLRASVYKTLDDYLLSLIERLWYIKAYPGNTDIYGNAFNNLIAGMDIGTFNSIGKVKTVMFPFIRSHIVILLPLWYQSKL